MTDFRRTSRLVFVTMAMILMVAPVSLAQNTSTIRGTVVDSTGAAIPGAVVQILDDAKQTLVRAATTDGSGRFEALYIQPGTYTIKVEKSGFKTLMRRPVTLDVTTQVYDSAFPLEIGSVTQSVSVTEITPLVQTSTGEKSFLVEQKLIADLPLDGRFFNALVATLPGVSDNGQSNFTIQNGTYLSDLHIAGGRASQNQEYLDGQPNLTGGDSSAVFVAAPLDSLSEFKVQVNDFSAEYGRSAGAVIAVQTKSGTDTFHGSAYGYVRNNAFDARNPIFHSGALANILRYNLFGGSLRRLAARAQVLHTREETAVFLFQPGADIPQHHWRPRRIGVLRCAESGNHAERKLQPVSSEHEHALRTAIQERHRLRARDHHAKWSGQYYRRDSLSRQRGTAGHVDCREQCFGQITP